MKLINHNSIIIGVLLLLGSAAYLLFKDGAQKTDFLILGIIAIGAFTAWAIFRPQSSGNTKMAEIHAQIGNDTPVLLELQSPY